MDQLDALYFEVYDQLYSIVRDPSGGVSLSHYSVWAPGLPGCEPKPVPDRVG